MPTQSRIDFATLKRPGSPNTYLLAPEGLCREAKADGAAPVYDVAAGKLRSEFLAVVIAEPRVSHTLADEAGLYDDLVQIFGRRQGPIDVGALCARRLRAVGFGCQPDAHTGVA
jgi:hypothetical protein